MRIIGFMVVGPREKYLENTLKEFKRLCDDAVIVGNNTDEATEKLIKSYGYWFYRDDREWGVHQPSIKTDLLARVARLKPDWILPLDADEVFAPEVTREVLEGLTRKGEIAWYFMIVNLYNGKDHFTHGVGIQRFWNIRFYKYLPQLGTTFLKKNLHCGLGPPYAYKYGWHAPYYVEHYGLMAKEDRDRKALRYAQFDPNAVFKGKEYYEDLQKDLKAIPFDRANLLTRLKESPDCQDRKPPKYE